MNFEDFNEFVIWENFDLLMRFLTNFGIKLSTYCENVSIVMEWICTMKEYVPR